MGNIDEIKKRKENIAALLEVARQKKQETIQLVNELVSQLASGKITKREYYDKLGDSLNFKTPEDWTKYYDDYILDCENKIAECDRLIKEEKTFSGSENRIKIIKFLIFIFFIGVIVSIILNFGPAIFTSVNNGNSSNANAGTVSNNASVPGTSELGSIKPFSPEIISKNPNPDLDIKTIQGGAVVGKAVRWESKIDMKSNDKFNIDIPIGSKLISMVDGSGKDILSEIKVNEVGKTLGLFGTGTDLEINGLAGGESYNMIFETLPPEISKEEIVENKERVVVKSDIHYENILSSVKISEKLNVKADGKEKLKLYQIVSVDGVEKRVSVTLMAYDTNEDGIIDKVEWITPHLSEAVFEIVIEISNAVHLDTNRTFIGDIYDSVKAQDGNWSEPIYHNEYVRVKFKKELNSSNDITFYARNVFGLNTSVEVYTADSDEKITEFPIITNEKKYKVLLSSMNGTSDTFDLKIKNLDDNDSAYLEFDYIVDPSYGCSGIPSYQIVTNHQCDSTQKYWAAISLTNPPGIGVYSDDLHCYFASDGYQGTLLGEAGYPAWWTSGYLGTRKCVSGVSLLLSGTGYSDLVDVYLSDDGINWGSPVATNIQVTNAVNNAAFAETAASYVKILIHDCTDSSSCNIAEFQPYTRAYGCVNDLGCTATGLKQCNGNTIQTCADYNSDGCLEWGADNPCGLLHCYAGTCTNNKLIAYYPFDENASDLSGNGNHGVNNGATFVAGKIGNSLIFNGASSYVSTSLDIKPATMPSMTWSGWIYPTTTSTLRQDIFSDDDGGFDRGLLIEANTQIFGVSTGSGVWQPTTATLNQWQFVAVIFNSTGIYFYKNGNKFVYGSAPTFGNTINYLNIGRNPAFNEYFNGKIDEVKIWNYALSDSEIQNEYSPVKIEIKTCADLQNIKTNLAGNYILDNDIDCNIAPFNSNPYFLALGNETTPFSGIFDGNMHVIYGLTMFTKDASSRNGWGLFGVTSSSAIIKNIGLVGFNIQGSGNNLQYLGSLVGWNKGFINDSFAIGKVRGADIIGPPTSYAYTVGGLVGFNDVGGAIKNTYAKVYVSASGIGEGSYSGGLVGSNSGTIINSYSTGNVTSHSDYVGGFVGSNSGIITNSYATGKIYSSGSFPSHLGGFGGSNSGTVTNSWFTDSTNNNGIGTFENGGNNKFFPSNHNVYTINSPVWDFTNIWVIRSSNYPVLKFKIFTDVDNCVVLNKSDTVYNLITNINRNDLLDNCINITAQNVTLDCSGFYIKSDDSFAGVYSNSSYTKIKNCNISMGTLNTGKGIYLNSENYSYLFNNTLNSNYNGILINSSWYNNLSGNTAYLGIDTGIKLVFYSNNNLLINNNATSEIYGIILDTSSNNSIINNSADRNGAEGIRLLSSSFNSLINNTANSNTNNGIYLETSSNNIIINNSAYYSEKGLFLKNSNYNNITNSTFSYCSGMLYEDGVHLESSNYNIFNNITANNNENDGILLKDSYYNNIQNSSFHQNQIFGVYLTTSNYNNISGIDASSNSISFSNGDGICLSSSSFNVINNSISNSNLNAGSGINLLTNSNNNQIVNITMNSNSNKGITLSSSSNNIISDSRLSGNTQDVYLNLISINNSFINDNYTLETESVAIDSQLIRKWYYRAYVNDTLGHDVINTNVTANNFTPGIEFTRLMTNSSGYTSITSITDYVNNGVSRIFYSNHSMNATNTTLKDGHTYNASLNKNNYKDFFTLKIPETPAYPEIVYISDMGYTAPGSASTADRTLSEDTYVSRNFEFCAYSTGGVNNLPGPGGPAISSLNVLLTIRDVINSPNRERRSSDSPGGVTCAYYKDDVAPAGSLSGYVGLPCRFYHCSAPFYYYDNFGWNIQPNFEIRPYVKDSFNQEDGYTPSDVMIKNSVDLPVVRTYFNKLDGYKMDPDGGTIDYGTVSYGNINKQPADASGPSPPRYPLRIRNTGNSDITQTQIKGQNLPGVTDNSKLILASWFSASPLASVCTLGTPLVANNFADTGIPTIARGPAPASESNLRVCLTTIQASATQQSYSTTATGGVAWTFRVVFSFAAFAIDRKKKKKNKNKINDEKIIQILKDNKKEIIDSIREELIKIKGEIISSEIKIGDNKKSRLDIPLSIFNLEIGPAEALSRYLHEEKKLKFSEISRLINRDQRTIWVNYNNSLKTKKIAFKEEGILLPLEVFSNRKLSILESVIKYLRDRGLKNSEIAEKINKDPRNIGTFYSRAVKKLSS